MNLNSFFKSPYLSHFNRKLYLEPFPHYLYFLWFFFGVHEVLHHYRVFLVSEELAGLSTRGTIILVYLWFSSELANTPADFWMKSSMSALCLLNSDTSDIVLTRQFSWQFLLKILGGSCTERFSSIGITKFDLWILVRNKGMSIQLSVFLAGCFSLSFFNSKNIFSLSKIFSATFLFIVVILLIKSLANSPLPLLFQV